jgi:hypothetical protein
MTDNVSPAQLALASFGPSSSSTVVSEQRAGDWAVVLLLTNGPDGEPYESVFHRQAGQGWAEVSGSNGYGWHSYGDGERGFATYWDETTSAERVTVSYRGTTKTVPVVSGYFLAVFWDDVSGNDFGSGDQPEWKTA